MQRLRGSPSIMVLLFYFSCRLPVGVVGLCPSRCQCDDELLQVSCDSANLDVVPITLNPDLRELRLKNNQIKSVMASFSVYHHLLYLDMSHNQLVSLGASNFAAQKDLRVLLLNRNMISALTNQTFLGLVDLQVLHLNENFLGEVPAGIFTSLAKLEKLDLSRNRISVVFPDAFAGLTNLRTLRLRDNKLDHIPAFPATTSPPGLLCLDLGLNYFREILGSPFASLAEMEELLLDGCGIARLASGSFLGLESLIKLKIHDNELETIPSECFGEVIHLEELYIGQNVFQELPQGAFPGLKYLKTVVINGAKNFCRVRTQAFSANANLERIVMNHNPQLGTIEAGAFAGLPNLRYVSLRGNSLQTLEGGLVPWDELETLDVRDNPLVCNCSLLWLRDYLDNLNASSHAEALGVSCANLGSVPLHRVTTDELNCYGQQVRRQMIIGTIVAAVVAVAALVMLAFRFREKVSRTLKSKWSTSGRKEPQYQKTSGEEEIPHCVKINPMTEL